MGGAGEAVMEARSCRAVTAIVWTLGLTVRGELWEGLGQTSDRTRLKFEKHHFVGRGWVECRLIIIFVITVMLYHSCLEEANVPPSLRTGT